MEATYSYAETEFTVEWMNIHLDTDEAGNYVLQPKTKASNQNLAARVDNAIREGDSPENPDLELYLSIRDRFNHMDCAKCDTPAFEITSAEEFDADYYGYGRYLTKLGGCSDNGGEFGLGDWTYQFEVLVTNQHGETKSFTVAYQPEERFDRIKNYSGYGIHTASTYCYDADASVDLP